MRRKTLRWMMVCGSLALGTACEPVGLDGSAAPAEAADTNVALARARVMSALSRSPANVRVRPLADGTRLAEIMSGFQHATIVTKGEGGLKRQCLSDTDEALRLLEGRRQ